MGLAYHAVTLRILRGRKELGNTKFPRLLVAQMVLADSREVEGTVRAKRRSWMVVVTLSRRYITSITCNIAILEQPPLNQHAVVRRKKTPV